MEEAFAERGDSKPLEPQKAVRGAGARLESIKEPSYALPLAKMQIPGLFALLSRMRGAAETKTMCATLAMNEIMKGQRMGKNKGSKIPKDVGGIKIPKKLRKTGGAALKLAQQPAVGEFVAAALTAAATSLMAETKAGKVVRRGTADAAAEGSREVTAIGGAVKRALLQAARELLDKLDDAAPEKVLARSEPEPETQRA